MVHNTVLSSRQCLQRVYSVCVCVFVSKCMYLIKSSMIDNFCGTTNGHFSDYYCYLLQLYCLCFMLWMSITFLHKMFSRRKFFSSAVCACACVNNLWWFDYSMWLILFWSSCGIIICTLSSPLLCAFPNTHKVNENERYAEVLRTYIHTQTATVRYSKRNTNYWSSSIEFMLINAFGKCENSSAKLKFYSCQCVIFALWIRKLSDLNYERASVFVYVCCEEKDFALGIVKL